MKKCVWVCVCVCVYVYTSAHTHTDERRWREKQMRMNVKNLTIEPGPTAGLGWWLSSKEILLQCRQFNRRCGFDPWVGKLPWKSAWQPASVFLPGESHGQRSLMGYSPWGHKRIGHDLAHGRARPDTPHHLLCPRLTLLEIQSPRTERLVRPP